MELGLIFHAALNTTRECQIRSPVAVLASQDTALKDFLETSVTLHAPPDLQLTPHALKMAPGLLTQLVLVTLGRLRMGVSHALDLTVDPVTGLLKPHWV